MSFIFLAGSGEVPADVGGKARALSALAEGDWPVPPWFVLRPNAFHASMGELGQGLLPGDGHSAPPESFWDDLKITEDARAELTAALARLCPMGELLAIRSSGLEEDGQRHSFAGQFDSYLGVRPADAEQKIVAVWKSAFSERVLRYVQQRGPQRKSIVPAVLIQRMVNAEAAGVAFSADPITGRRTVAVVSAVFGLGSSLVSGELDADTWKLERSGKIVARSIARKEMEHIATLDGVQRRPVAESKRRLPAIAEDQVRAVAALVRAVAKHFGSPQDIEWALQGREVYLLQARPITTLATRVDPDGQLRIWDNSNITESYSGVTTPLTFTFARRAYEGVYRQFCRLLAVPRARIVAHQSTYREMLGLIRGRIYYNLLNWYRVLALLPGFTFNRRLMEQMMGVKEPLPPELVDDLNCSSLGARTRDLARLAWMCGVIIAHYCFLPKTIRRFQQRLREALLPPPVPLELKRTEELAADFLELERKLLTRWDAPLLNDFFTMIFTGVLRRFTGSWCGDAEGCLMPALLCGPTNVISSEPARRIFELARLASGDEQLITVLREGSIGEIRSAVQDQPQLQEGVEAYLAAFEDRCLDELKLESLSLRDDPLPVFRSIGRVATGSSDRRESLNPAGPQHPQAAAERVAMRHLAGHPLRRVAFRWVLRESRARTRDRENLRFERTRLFGRARQVFVQIGQRLAADGHLAHPRDVFYLEVDEILGFVSGTSTAVDLQKLALIRKAEFDEFRQGPPPPPRLMTRGSPYQGQQPVTSPSATQLLGPEVRQGISCCPGAVRGSARVIRDPKHDTVEPGQILVAEQTDPGWILLFAGAKGLLVERGSLLSHSAIVARELAIPMIVGVPGLTRWLKDGDHLEMDGATGIVRRLSTDPMSPSTSANPHYDQCDADRARVHEVLR